MVESGERNQVGYSISASGDIQLPALGQIQVPTVRDKADFEISGERMDHLTMSLG